MLEIPVLSAAVSDGIRELGVCKCEIIGLAAILQRAVTPKRSNRSDTEWIVRMDGAKNHLRENSYDAATSLRWLVVILAGFLFYKCHKTLFKRPRPNRQFAALYVPLALAGVCWFFGIIGGNDGNRVIMDASSLADLIDRLAGWQIRVVCANVTDVLLLMCSIFALRIHCKETQGQR